MEHVQSLFDKIAKKYDMMNDIISFGRHRAWRRKTMKLIGMKEGQSALDLCCGTCDWTIDLAEASRTGPITGLDFSQNMLDIGKQKVNKLGLDKQISLVHGNAMELPFEDNRFDIVTIGFGLRNTPDYLQVLKEMCRVVKPGGQIVCLEMSKPTMQPLKGIYYFYFEKIMPYFGKLFAKDYKAYAWLPESLKKFPNAEQLAELFKEAGASDVKVNPFFGGIAALHYARKK